MSVSAPLILSVTLTPNPVEAKGTLKIAVLVEECTHTRLEQYTHSELSVYTHSDLATKPLD